MSVKGLPYGLTLRTSRKCYPSFPNCVLPTMVSNSDYHRGFCVSPPHAAPLPPSGIHQHTGPLGMGCVCPTFCDGRRSNPSRDAVSLLPSSTSNGTLKLDRSHPWHGTWEGLGQFRVGYWRPTWILSCGLLWGKPPPALLNSLISLWLLGRNNKHSSLHQSHRIICLDNLTSMLLFR